MSEKDCESHHKLENRQEQAGVCMTKMNRKKDWFCTSHYPVLIFLSVRKSPPVQSKTSRYYLKLETETKIKHDSGEEILFHCHDFSTEESSLSSLIRCFQSSTSVLCQINKYINIEVVYFGHTSPISLSFWESAGSFDSILRIFTSEAPDLFSRWSNPVLALVPVPG